MRKHSRAWRVGALGITVALAFLFTLPIANPHHSIKPAGFVPEGAAASLLLPQPQSPGEALRVLYDRASQTYAKIDSYIHRMKRREVFNGVKNPEEVMLVKFRKEPFSVYIKWLGTQGKGREIVYVKGKFDNKMHLSMAAGDIFKFSPAGMKFALQPDDPLAKSKSRHAITETGFGHIIERFGRIVAAIEKNDPREGKVEYLGKVKRPEFEQPVEAVHHVIPEKLEPLLPKGGQRWYHFDATSGLPVLTIAHDATGEVEYYCNDHIQFPVRLDDEDFNPERLGKK